jgi:hypothetical protein
MSRQGLQRYTIHRLLRVRRSSLAFAYAAEQCGQRSPSGWKYSKIHSVLAFSLRRSKSKPLIVARFHSF